MANRPVFLGAKPGSAGGPDGNKRQLLGPEAGLTKEESIHVCKAALQAAYQSRVTYALLVTTSPLPATSTAVEWMIDAGKK